MLRAIAGIGIAFLSLIGLLLVGGAAIYYSLPDVNAIKGCLTTTMFKVRLCDRDPSFVKLSDISPNIIGAVIMSEDASFNYHEGFDLTEMKESLIKDVNKGHFARGGSTITQQLAKNVFLSNEKSITRKVKEIYLATQIEKLLTKSRILTLYLNVVEFGPNLFGIKAACKHYFNKLPHEVTPEQAAFLAFLLPNPPKYSQSFRERRLTPFARQTVGRILHKMLLGHKITEDEYQAAASRIDEFPWDGSVTTTAGETTELDIQPGETSEPIEEREDDFKFDFDESKDQ